MNQNTDIAIAPFITTFQRSQVISFIHALDNVHDEVAIKNPTDTFNFGAHTDPLQLWSWIFIAIFCIVCPPFLYFTARFGGKDLRQEEFTLAKSFIVTLYGIILKGWNVTPTKLSPRLAFITITLFACALYLLW